MAIRTIFLVSSDNKVFEEQVDFKYYSGFAAVLKQKSILSLHEEIKKSYNDNILEISSKSLNPLGTDLSAFNLKVQMDNKLISIENIFQSSNVFEYGGPYTDLLNTTPIEAKKDERLRNSGHLISFKLKNKIYPIVP